MGWIRAVVVTMLAVTCLAGCAQTEADRYEPRKPTVTFSPTACASALGRVTDVAVSANTDDALLRSDQHPRAALICNYRGPSGPAPSRTRDLASRLELGRKAATRLAASASQVSVAKPAPGTTSCPADFGTTTVITFAYADAPSASLWWLTSGCQTLDNGRVRASLLANQSFSRFEDVFTRVVRLQE